MSSSYPVAIIGAGPCGIAACKALAQADIPFDCYEAGDSVGGVWNVGSRKGGYRSLTTNTSNPNMAFSDFAFRESDPSYLKAADLKSYFDRYVDHFGFRSAIKFETSVAKITRSDDDAWVVTTAAGDAHSYSAVVVATGQYASPRTPHSSTPGSFVGEHLHSHDYFDVDSPVDMRDKTVLVVGLGTSAAEIAAELSDPNHPVGKASRVLLSARSGRWVMPKIADGIPMDSRAPHAAQEPPGIFKYLPTGVGSFAMRRVMAKGLKSVNKSYGGATALGLPEPTIQPWVDRPTLSFDFIPALQAGRIDIRPAIERFDDRTVTFSDGSQAEVDVILYATGYDSSFPFLDRQTLGCESNDLALYQRVAHPEQNGLFFIGFCKVMCSLWPVAEQQSRWLAKYLSGEFALPSSSVLNRKAVPLRQSLPVMCNMYVEELRREAGGQL